MLWFAVEKALAVCLVANLRDVANIGLLFVFFLVLVVVFLRLRLLGGLGDDDKAGTVGRPRKTGDALGQFRYLPGFATVGTDQPDLGLIGAV